VIKIPRVYIAAIKKTSGKTTIAIALNRIFKEMNMIVQPFKKGPDFIDPMWHTQAAGRACRNLDFFFLPKARIANYFISKAKDADISIIEGNHGLFDDIEVEGGSDNATLAKLLSTPIILIIDVKEMGRTIVPIILGCKNFDTDLKIGGVILNRIQNSRQKKRLEEAISRYINIPILGTIPENKDISIAQRHLGLSSTLSRVEREEVICKISDYLKRFLDIKGILRLANSTDRLPDEQDFETNQYDKKQYNSDIGVALDEAFNFYYPDNLEALESLGCTLHFFSPLRDSRLPKVDAIYIGGGFPELFLEELESNETLRGDLRKFIESGKPLYAECGGLVYLTKKIGFRGKEGNMVGAIDTESSFQEKPVGHGYTILEPNTNHKGWWSRLRNLVGHEFHHALLNKTDNRCAFKIKRGFGINRVCDGIITKNSLASFTHIHALGNVGFFAEWVGFIENLGNQRRVYVC